MLFVNDKRRPIDFLNKCAILHLFYITFGVCKLPEIETSMTKYLLETWRIFCKQARSWGFSASARAQSQSPEP